MANKQQMLKDVKVKVEELVQQREAVEAVIDEVEDKQAEAEKKAQELQAELEQAQEVVDTSTDAEQIKQAMQTVKQVQEELELEQSVDKALDNKKAQEMAQKADDFYKTYNSIRFSFKPLVKEFVAETNINSIEKDVETLQEVASTVNAQFGAVKGTLIDAEIISQGDNFYTTMSGQRVHLSRAGLDVADLRDLKRAFQPVYDKLFKEIR